MEAVLYSVLGGLVAIPFIWLAHVADERRKGGFYLVIIPLLLLSLGALAYTLSLGTSS